MLDADTNTIDYAFTWQNLTGEIVAPGFHLHGPAVLGTNAGVVVDIVGDTGSGIDPVGGNVMAPLPATGSISGQAILTDSLETALLDGLLARHPAGARGDGGRAALRRRRRGRSGRAIRDLPAFQVDGRFDRETYERQVRSSGLSLAAFEQSFRDDTALNQFRTGVVDTSFTLPGEAERSTRSPASAVPSTPCVSIWRWPRRRSNRARRRSSPASRRTPMPTVSPSGRRSTDRAGRRRARRGRGPISDEQVRSRYEESRASYVRPEQREASHILLTLDPGADEDELADKRATLDAARERIGGGEAFADVARELSEDVGSAEAGAVSGSSRPARWRRSSRRRCTPSVPRATSPNRSEPISACT